jgi:hypothetical protein
MKKINRTRVFEGCGFVIEPKTAMPFSAEKSRISSRRRTPD